VTNLKKKRKQIKKETLRTKAIVGAIILIFMVIIIISVIKIKDNRINFNENVKDYLSIKNVNSLENIPDTLEIDIENTNKVKDADCVLVIDNENKTVGKIKKNKNVLKNISFDFSQGLSNITLELSCRWN
jgi:hypothetical protein